MILALISFIALMEASVILFLLRRRYETVEPENSHPGRVLPKGVPINHALKAAPDLEEERPPLHLHLWPLTWFQQTRLPVGDPKDLLRQLLLDQPTPQYPPAEQAMLGAMIFDENQILKVQKVLPAPRMLSAFRHVIIYQVILRLHEEEFPVDLVTLRHELGWNGLLDLVGGPAYLMELVESVPNADNAEEYARTVLHHFLRRSL